MRYIQKQTEGQLEIRATNYEDEISQDNIVRFAPMLDSSTIVMIV